MAQEGLVLTGAGSRSGEDQEREGKSREFESECPGYCGAQDTF